MGFPALALRFAVRYPTYVLLSSATLAAALGANLLVFSVGNALWLRPMPFAEADRLIMLPGTSFSSLVDLKEAMGPGAGVAGQVVTDDRFGLRFSTVFPPLGQESETVAVTSEYFRVLGVRVRGRDFRQADDREGAEPVAIISDELWAMAFGRDRGIVGSVIATEPVPLRIVGVAARGFRGSRRGERTEVWIPRAVVPRIVPGGLNSSVPLSVIARLSTGQTRLDASRALNERFGRSESSDIPVVFLKDVYGTPSSATTILDESQLLSIVAALAVLVLIGGCATLAATVLVHYERRRAELSMRTALGASRGELMRQLLFELVVVTLVGASGAAIWAVVGLEIVPALTLPGGVNLSRLDLSPDWRVFGVGIGLAVATVALASWLPLNRSTRIGLMEVLASRSTVTASASSLRLRQLLLATLVGTTVVVLVAAGLFVRVVAHGFGRGPGFAFDRTVFVTVQLVNPLGAIGVLTPEMMAERTRLAREALGSLPGVDVVAEGRAPIDAAFVTRLESPVKLETNTAEHELSVGRLDGSADLYLALGLPLLAGRGLTGADEGVRPLRTLVTASLASTLWPNEQALGRILSVDGANVPQHEIVGIVADFALGSLAERPAGVVLTASGVTQGIRPRFVLSALDADTLVARIPDTVQMALPGSPFVSVTTGRELIARDLGRQRLGAWFFSGFGLTALVLGVGGVFGLVAYLTESRQREFGLRMTLGATPATLMRHSVNAALVPVLIGTVAGLAGAATVSGLFASLLVGVPRVDTPTYAVVALAVVMSAAGAAGAAALRLRRVEPTEALRNN